jgi:hypothetical protein
VLARGGNIELFFSGIVTTRAVTASDLPSNSFKIVEIKLPGAQDVPLESMRLIGSLRHLKSLSFHSANVSDQHLEPLSNLKSLRALELGDTKITGAGLST